ncbi:MAG: hypothetical protein IJE00_02395 [Clostridia bacterium]|nr:hypothetical protein [Clostridia bacterium]
MRPTLIKITAAVAVGALLLAVCPTAAEPTPRRSGDLNDDGIVNSADQRLLLQATGGAADLDQNNVVDDRDADLLWRLSLGMLTEDELGDIIEQTPDETTTLPTSTTTASSETTTESGGSSSSTAEDPTSSSTTSTTKPTTSTTTTTKKTTTTTKKTTTTSTTTTTKPTTSTTKPTGSATPVAQVRPTLEAVTVPPYTPTLKTGGKANSEFDLTVKNTNSGKIYTNATKEDLQLLLTFIVKAECGQASFAPNSTEGWKAQAVAAYTHLCYQARKTGEYTYNFWVPAGKDVDLKHKNDKRIYDAVGEVVGIGIFVKGKEAICAYYSGSCPGTTRNNYTGYDLSYIQPVFSPETTALCEKYGYTLNSTVTTTMDELKATLGEVLDETIYADTKSGCYPLYATSWSGAHVDKTNLYYKSGSSKVYLTGHQVRTYMGWKSASFVVTDMSGDTMTVSVSAHGHGMGYTQVGAAIFANEYGWTYDQILAHYYCITAKSTHQLYKASW